MSAPTEQEIRDNIARWSVGREHRVLPWTQKRFAFLLELLDAERAKVARLDALRRCSCMAEYDRQRRGQSEPAAHRPYCREYVGPLSHSWVRTSYNETFGGLDHWCSCGGWFRQGGLAGHGDGTETAEPVCPRAHLSETSRQV